MNCANKTITIEWSVHLICSFLSNLLMHFCGNRCTINGFSLFLLPFSQFKVFRWKTNGTKQKEIFFLYIFLMHLSDRKRWAFFFTMAKVSSCLRLAIGAAAIAIGLLLFCTRLIDENNFFFHFNEIMLFRIAMANTFTCTQPNKNARNAYVFTQIEINFYFIFSLFFF